MSARSFALLLVLAGVPSCRCDGKLQTSECERVTGNQADHPGTCATSAECGAHHECTGIKDREGLSCCLFTDRACTTEADCCPGQTCPPERKKCFDKFLTCETDADCGDVGDRFCEPYSDFYGQSKRCRFKACQAGGACPSGQSCFQGECMAGLPCSGTCEPGKGCVPSIDRCQDYRTPADPARAGATCPMSCAPGFLATFSDSRNIRDSCDLNAVKCVCAELPALQSDDVGRFTSVAADPTAKELVISLYDGQYGDLVVDRYQPDGKRRLREYVDGVPKGVARYGPSGPRKGVVDPGDDVGRYSDVAVANGLTYVSYYDVTHGDLKFATRAGDGSWSTVTVDGAQGDVGLYASLAIDGDGLPGIAYFQRGGEAGFDISACPSPRPVGELSLVTALKLARAKKKNPGAGDFTVSTIACKLRSPPACAGCGQICADPGTGPGCYEGATTCVGCDPNIEACVKIGGVSKCAPKYNPSTLSEVVDGVGLFPSLGFQQSTAVIAFMRRTRSGEGKPSVDGDLLGVTVYASGVQTALVTLDSTGDTGWFPDLAIDPSTRRVAISYHDFTSRALKLYLAQGLTSGVTAEKIDTGVTAPGTNNWVGTSSAISFGPNDSGLYALYQDGSQSDLLLSRRAPAGGWQRLPALRTEGAVGFFVHGAWFDGGLYVGHAQLKARRIGGEPRLENRVLLDRYPPP